MQPLNDFAVRLALPSDAAALAELAERTFRATFADSCTPADMELHCRESYGEALQRTEIADSARLMLVCTDGDALIAFATLRPDAPHAAVTATAPGEIQRFYVDPDWHGRGLAQALMAASLQALRDRGADVAWLGVFERNARAIAFYEKAGFAVVGKQIFTVGTDPQRDWVIARPLD